MKIALRRATAADARFVWETNNDPAVRAQSISTASIPWESHERWYARKLEDPAALLFVGECDNVPAAVVRFDVEGSEATIGVAVQSSFQGKGVGSRVIAAATEALRRVRPEARAVAWIRPDNAASLRAFGRAGYARCGSDVRDGVSLERYEAARAREV